MSKKYIDADVLLEEIEKIKKYDYFAETGNIFILLAHIDVAGAINRQPAADVVEVVRCGQCKFFQSSGCFIGIQGAQISSDNYCAWGQRKDG